MAQVRRSTRASRIKRPLPSIDVFNPALPYFSLIVFGFA